MTKHEAYIKVVVGLVINKYINSTLNGYDMSLAKKP